MSTIPAGPIHPSTWNQTSTISNHSGTFASQLSQPAEQAQQARETAHYSSAESDDDHDHTTDRGSLGEKRKQRSRACVACRNMKIRCNPVEGSNTCLACSKVGRDCILPGPIKKRQKTAHKVAELEAKIDALTRSLRVKSGQAQTPAASPVLATSAGSASTNEPFLKTPPQQQVPLFPPQNPPAATLSSPEPTALDSVYSDVVDRGLIDLQLADQIFHKFMIDLIPLCPIVAFKPGTTMSTVRRTRPMLFLAMLCAAGAWTLGERYEQMVDELAKQLAHRMYYLFERSMDLIQASLVLVTWIGKHRVAKDLGFNMYIHAAMVMAMDLGLGKRFKTALTKDSYEDAEMRRTWLACYWLAVSVSLTLRHPSTIRCSSYTTDCLAFLRTSPAACLHDRTLIAQCEIVSILEDVANVFHMDDPSSSVSMADRSTQYNLKLFCERLKSWRTENEKILPEKMLNLLYSCAMLYMHEIALHEDHNVDDFRPPTSRPGGEGGQDTTSLRSKDFITPAHLGPLNTCVVSMKGSLDAYLAYQQVMKYKSLPCLYTVWTAYAIIAMIRLDGALRASKSQYADVFLPDLKVEYYLDNIIARLESQLRDLPDEMTRSVRPANLFRHAFQKLKLWHMTRLSGGKVDVANRQVASDPKNGLDRVNQSIGNIVAEKKGQSTPSDTAQYHTAHSVVDGNTVSMGQENGFIGGGPLEKLPGMGLVQYQQLRAGREAGEVSFGDISVDRLNSQHYNVYGGSWLTNPAYNTDFDASAWEMTDPNFNLADWNMFEQSMMQPAQSNWLDYLI